MAYICQRCLKTYTELEAEGKLRFVQGYAQCSDCGTDLEARSVVQRREMVNAARLRGQVMGEVNWSQFLPLWYQEEQRLIMEKSRREWSLYHRYMDSVHGRF